MDPSAIFPLFRRDGGEVPSAVLHWGPERKTGYQGVWCVIGIIVVVCEQ